MNSQGTAAITSEKFIKNLLSDRYRVRLRSFSALDNYLGLSSLPFVFLETDADIAIIARYAADLRFPGADMADAAVDSGGKSYYFQCRDNLKTKPVCSYKILSLTREADTGRYLDTYEIYSQIQSLKKFYSENNIITGWWNDFFTEKHPDGCGFFHILTDGAIILSRYEAAEFPPKDFIDIIASGIENETEPVTEMQRMLLTALMVSRRPDRGFKFLKAAGFLKKLWPEIARLNNVDHSKEFHPEGNAWEHTLSTFEHRKQNASGEFDLLLSMALLLHDIGKPIAGGGGGRRFDGHAELGAAAARRFLERLEFDPEFVSSIFYLVKNHMLPAALARLPLLRTGGVMNSMLFPLLMELYRCDESSSFKGLEDYYQNSAAYQTYLKNIKNPFRSADGKVLGRRH